METPSLDTQKRTTTITRLLVAMLVVLVVLCFYPLSSLFFSQDDFGLIHEAVGDLGGQLNKVFVRGNSYHFRPLTKHVYYFVMFKMFGMNAVPYHLASLLLHAVNTLLVFLLLRRFRVPVEAAAVGAACFGLNASYFHAVGWIACIQQLMPTTFSLASILAGLKALDNFDRGGRGRALRWAWMSGLAYAGALLGNEQSFAVPVFTLAASLLKLQGARHRSASVLRILGPQIVLMLFYLAMRFFWKGLPSTGISRFVFEANIRENLLVYASAYFWWWPDVNTVITLSPFAIRPTHFALALIVIYQLVRRRFGAAVFSLLVLAATISPALPQHKHYHFYHLYIGGFAVAYLVAGPLMDLLADVRVGRHRSPAMAGAAAILMLALFIPAAVSVRSNIDRASNIDSQKYAGSFVVRRAEIARNAWDSWHQVLPYVQGATTINLFHSDPNMKIPSSRGRMGGQNGEVVWSLAQGRALNVFLNKHDVTVNMRSVGGDQERVVRLFYDSVGRLRASDPGR